MAKKQKPKKGRVVRLTEDLVAILDAEHKTGERIHDTVRRLFKLGHGAKIRYVLPADLSESLAEARGKAIVRAVKTKNGFVEKPVAVRET